MFGKIKEKLVLAQRQMMHRLHVSASDEEAIVRQFNRLYYDSHLLGKTWGDTHWLGHQLMKAPTDLWLYQEILHKVRPDLIIETGTYKGGSAYYLASLCQLLGKGQVISIDVEQYPDRPKHERITYLTGSSVSDDIVKEVARRVAGLNSVMVILDSDHTKDHVLRELEAYYPYVTSGSYVIVEDSNVNGHPVWPEFGPGPMEALDSFLAVNKEFVIDRNMEKFLLTFNPRGYLKRL
jgi:cephalosporin hydroxylase